MLVTHPDFHGESNDTLKRLVEMLKEIGFVTDTLSHGALKFMGVCRLLEVLQQSSERACHCSYNLLGFIHTWESRSVYCHYSTNGRSTCLVYIGGSTFVFSLTSTTGQVQRGTSPVVAAGFFLLLATSAYPPRREFTLHRFALLHWQWVFQQTDAVRINRHSIQLHEIAVNVSFCSDDDAERLHLSVVSTCTMEAGGEQMAVLRVTCECFLAKALRHAPVLLSN